ncbi:TPR repeat-containing protein, partial [Candidatus Magnetomorum sp. HK-1]
LYMRAFPIKYKEYLNLLHKYKDTYSSSQKSKTIILVTGVIEGSQAKSIGIYKGDIIKNYLGNKLKTTRELIKIVSANANSKRKKINIMIIRNGETPIELSISPGRIGVQIETVDLSHL